MVLRDLGLGDLLTAVPTLRGLRRSYPDARISLVCGPSLEPLARATGAVDRVVGEVEHHPDLAVNLHGKGPQSHRRVLRRHPRRLLAFRHPDVPETAGCPEWRAEEHEVHRWCRLAAYAGWPADPSDLAVDMPGRPPRQMDVTVVHPGAASAARRWPAERFAAVAAKEAQDGRRVIVTSGPTEADLALAVARRAGLPRAAVANPPSVMDLVRLVASAGRLVSGDTGVAHVATAVGTPSVVIFGPTPPAFWGPPPERPWHRALWAGQPGDPHGRRPGKGILAISVEDVLAELADPAFAS